VYPDQTRLRWRNDIPIKCLWEPQPGQVTNERSRNASDIIAVEIEVEAKAMAKDQKVVKGRGRKRVKVERKVGSRNQGERSRDSVLKAAEWPRAKGEPDADFPPTWPPRDKTQSSTKGVCWALAGAWCDDLVPHNALDQFPMPTLLNLHDYQAVSLSSKLQDSQTPLTVQDEIHVIPSSNRGLN
jgi:hypothetical protein